MEEGDPVLIIPQLAKKIDAKFVFWNRSIEHYEINRDLKIKKNLEERKIQVIETCDHLLVEPLKIFSGNINPYSVYGPFYKNLKLKMNLLGSYDQKKVIFQFKDIDNKLKENKTLNSSDSVLKKFLKNIKFTGSNICPCRPGENAAVTLLENFIIEKKYILIIPLEIFLPIMGHHFLVHLSDSAPSALEKFGTQH